ncbi:MAG: phosphoribosylanthranilate isomerase, partial [Gammaproteobacteria bacterium]|nr:phosphoribosylanthranilate isomerase [Gammaproteobacteria bacterium]
MKIKICCTANAEEALLARAAGATAIGLVGEMPSGPGVIGVEAAATIVRALPSDIDTFFLTSKVRADDIETELVRCGANTVQVVQHIDPREHERLQATLPHVRRVQVIHVENERALELVDAYAERVDAFLLDSGQTAGAKPQFGGTGSVHDWSISRQFVESTDL